VQSGENRIAPVRELERAYFFVWAVAVLVAPVVDVEAAAWVVAFFAFFLVVLVFVVFGRATPSLVVAVVVLVVVDGAGAVVGAGVAGAGAVPWANDVAAKAAAIRAVSSLVIKSSGLVVGLATPNGVSPPLTADGVGG
jgi:hypothetical protein